MGHVRLWSDPEGEGATLDAGHRSRVIDVQGGAMDISGVHFVRGLAWIPSAAQVALDGCRSVPMIDSQGYHTKVSNGGGGLRTCYSNISLTRVTFSDCMVSEGEPNITIRERSLAPISQDGVLVRLQGGAAFFRYTGVVVLDQVNF